MVRLIEQSNVHQVCVLLNSRAKVETNPGKTIMKSVVVRNSKKKYLLWASF